MTLSDIMDHHPFFALWRPDFFLIALVLGIVYVLVFVSYRHKLPIKSEPVSRNRIIIFFIGLGLFYILHGTPLHVIGFEYLFSAHMLQMAFTYMIVSPLLLLGIPSWAWAAMLEHRFFRRWMPVITHPLAAVLLFNLTLALYHIPVIFDFVMSYHPFHLAYHYLLFFASLILWWPIVTPAKQEKQTTFLTKLGYIIAGSILITPICALVIFASDAIYTTYANAPTLFESLTTHRDQQWGGIIMKMIQELAFMTALIISYFHWTKNERTNIEIDPIDQVNHDYTNESHKGISFDNPSTEQGGS